MSVTSDREEGEIVDDYEYIISSDEENVRQRIHELEQKNYELEQIAKISDSFTNAYNGAAKTTYKNNIYVLSDASSISSEELEIPERRRRKSRHKESHRKKHQRKQSRSRHRKQYRKSNTPETEQQELRQLRGRLNEELANLKDDELALVGSRAKLHIAVARNMNGVNKVVNTALKERLLKDSNFLPLETIQNKDTIEEIVDKTNAKQPIAESEEESLSADEQELRLIALKSAVLNKHMARKRRNAEVAYSPTDFTDLFTNGDSTPLDDDNMELELIDLSVGMDISPALSPHNSTTDCEIFESSVNTRPVDMDLAQSDSDLEITKSPDANWPVLEDTEYPATMHFGIYMPEMQFQHPDKPAPPPPPPLDIVSKNIDEVFEKESRAALRTAVEEAENDVEIEDVDEEEEALRALLLSKLQQTKAKSTEKLQNDDDVVKETEKDIVNPTELILKQAVRRLRAKLINEEPKILDNMQHVLPKISVKSVQAINNELCTHGIVNNIIEIVISDSEEDKNDKQANNMYNNNALRDISCNVQNSPNLDLGEVKMAQNIPSVINLNKTNINLLKHNKIVNKALVLKRKSIKTLKAKEDLRIMRRENAKNKVTKPKSRKRAVLNKTATKTTTTACATTLASPITTIEATVPTTTTITTTTSSTLTNKKATTTAVGVEKKTTTRLILTMPKVQVNKFVVNLASSESSEESDINDSTKSFDNSIDVSDIDYYNHINASPISLTMDNNSSNNNTPICQSPAHTNPIDTPNGANFVNDHFQQRLDMFLKNVRTNISISTNTTTTATTSKMTTTTTSLSSSTTTTTVITRTTMTTSTIKTAAVSNTTKLQPNKTANVVKTTTPVVN